MLNLKINLSLVEDFYLYYFLSVSSLLSINAVELRDALTTNSNVTRGREKKQERIAWNFLPFMSPLYNSGLTINFLEKFTREWKGYMSRRNLLLTVALVRYST